MAKRDLLFDPSIMNAAGTLGFVPDQHSLVDWGLFGAFVTNPISLNGRTPAHGSRYAEYPGGFLLHTGYPNPGLSQVLKRFARQWGHSPLPVIVHLLAHNPGEVVKMARQLETVEGVGGLELGIPGDASLELTGTLTQAAAGELPLIVRLPSERALQLAGAAIQAGAMAVSLAPPRGVLPMANGELIQGRLYGPALLPTAFKVVQDLVKLGIPTIGAGGVYSMEHYKAMLLAGAMAVQLDGILWRGGGYNIFGLIE